MNQRNETMKKSSKVADKRTGQRDGIRKRWLERPNAWKNLTLPQICPLVANCTRRLELLPILGTSACRASDEYLSTHPFPLAPA